MPDWLSLVLHGLGSITYGVFAVVFVVVFYFGWVFADHYIGRADKARVRIGHGDSKTFDADKVATRYVPYAILSARVYEPIGPNGELPSREANTTSLPDAALELLYDHWECIYAVSGSLPQPNGPPWDRYRRTISGLGMQIWRSRPKIEGSEEFVIAFRGTEWRNSGDWIANFRWVTRYLKYFDHYRQVQAHINERVAWIKANNSYRPNSKIVAVGHSLGGGLAQQAAYANREIRFVCAFDSTPVTGFYEVERRLRAHNRKGLRIDRVYQGGEILAYLRSFMSRLYEVDARNPEIRDVRFDYMSKGNPFKRHAMAALAAHLMTKAPKATASPRAPEPALSGDEQAIPARS